ncbi:MAG TPA: DUF3024 domain-containing protein [Candidatus Limnocylindrales bacterium]|nr:DUF3024 domain-containing protein [Candidatus Limnocylindrales bacterium]
MAIPVLVKKLAEEMLIKYCEGKGQEHLKGKFRIGYAFKGNTIIVYEERINYQDSTGRIEVPVAKLSYDIESDEWSLFSVDNKSRWHKYSKEKPNKDISKLLRTVDEDSTGIFWG